MAAVERISVYPVKGLDGIDVETTEILDGGTFRYDREFALFDTEGEVLNGKRTEQIHDLSTDFDPVSKTFSVETTDGIIEQFDLDTDDEMAAEWFSDYFSVDLNLRRDPALGFVDRREMGPSVISTATLETVASWFDEVTVDGARRRLRANLEVSGVPAFWEDRFVGDDAPAFEVDGVRFEGVTPCGRCIVPERDPNTGTRTTDFRERFIRSREQTFPEWADSRAFDHYYSVMTIARIPQAHRGRTVGVGDSVEVVE